MLKTLFNSALKIFYEWIETRRAIELENIQKQINQQQWKTTLEQHTHEADLAAGYNLSHFNTMQ